MGSITRNTDKSLKTVEPKGLASRKEDSGRFLVTLNLQKRRYLKLRQRGKARQTVTGRQNSDPSGKAPQKKSALPPGPEPAIQAPSEVLTPNNRETGYG